ncbi:2,4'-dihydroxyacetophenone dioxygenase family protein [Candidatus Protofrankia californiensis]|uniref:2,4'-dihydroxyacetophenone dioxygenase family protein n=1 Tax=Candidatus Protofrankia californiensis TaxID=1839754 RepID=UPI0010417267|nr:2,4'-dihydroxyacetophenone dioxygenase family protein [Candidatus Protofrankia californiensis]
MTTLDTTVQHFAPTHTRGDDLLWHPFTPYSNDVQLKILHVDLIKSETQMFMRAPGGASLGVHDHFGRVLVYTIRGNWRYAEHDWVSGPGDFVYEVANSRHTFIVEPGEDVELFISVEGALAFLGLNDEIIGIEQAHTFAERHNEHCKKHGITPVDLTMFAVS